MGAIKDVTDLVIELEKRITDRKILDMLLPIKQKINEVTSENLNLKKEQLELEKSHFRMEKELHDKIEDLKKSHSQEMENIKKSHAQEISKIKKESRDSKSKIEELEAELGKPKPRVRLPMIA